jgi:hypothetical protein
LRLLSENHTGTMYKWNHLLKIIETEYLITKRGSDLSKYYKDVNDLENCVAPSNCVAQRTSNLLVFLLSSWVSNYIKL